MTVAAEDFYNNLPVDGRCWIWLCTVSTEISLSGYFGYSQTKCILENLKHSSKNVSNGIEGHLH